MKDSSQYFISADLNNIRWREAQKRMWTESTLGRAALLAVNPTHAHRSSQQQHSCENPSPLPFIKWLCQSLNAFVKETFPSVVASDCYREEFDSKTVSAPSMHAPQAAPRLSCKVWLCPDTQHLFEDSSVALANIKHHLSPPQLFHSKCQKPMRMVFL